MQGTLLEDGWTYTMQSVHTFGPREQQWLVEEILFVADEEQVSDYHVDHPRNSRKSRQKCRRTWHVMLTGSCTGVLVIDDLQADVSHLRERIKITRPRQRALGEVHYKVWLELEFRVDGRDMIWTAKWEDERVASGRCSVAAALHPGTE
jgi:hypothetical protein